MTEENETTPDAPEQEPGPLDDITDHEELYKKFFEEFDADTDERKSKAFDESEENPLAEITDHSDLYKKAFDAWDAHEIPSEDMRFPDSADSSDFEEYVSENWDAIQAATFRGLPPLTHQEAGNFAAFLESFRADDVTTAAEKSRNLILMQRRGQDVSHALIQAGLRQLDHRRRGDGTPRTEAE